MFRHRLFVATFLACLTLGTAYGNYADRLCPTDDAQFISASQGYPLVIDYFGDGRPVLALFEAGKWIIDADRNGIFDESVDPTFHFGQSGDIPVFGDFDGNGSKEVGVFRNGQWILDTNNSQAYEGLEDTVRIFGQAGDIPVVGDFNGNGRTQLAVFRNGTWLIDMDGDGQWNPEVDLEITGFGRPGDHPLAADWNGLGFDRIGIYSKGQWMLDLNGNFHWDGAQMDLAWSGFGTATSHPLPGDWNDDGHINPGIRDGTTYVLDTTGDGRLNQGSCDPNEPPVGEFDPGALPSTEDGSGICGADLNNDGLVTINEMDNCDFGICPIERAECILAEGKFVCPLGNYACGETSLSTDVFLDCPDGSQYNAALDLCQKQTIVLSGGVFQAGFYDLFVNPSHPNRLYTTYYGGEPARGDLSYLEFNLVDGAVEISGRMWQEGRWDTAPSGNQISWHVSGSSLGITEFVAGAEGLSLFGPRVLRPSFLDVRPLRNRLDFYNVGWVGSISFELQSENVEPLRTRQRFCSPYPCVEEIVAIEDDEPDMGSYRNDGEVDPTTGVCLGEIFIFNGKPGQCMPPGVKTSFFNCCNSSDSSWLIFQKYCDERAWETAHAVETGTAVYIGEYCRTRWPLIGCVQRARLYCIFSGKLAAQTHIQGRVQLKNFQPGGDWGSTSAPNCRGFSPEEFSVLDFGAMDLSTVYGELVPTVPMQSIEQDALDAANRYPGL
ncbi:conjugal transfer protein TraN [Geoalkalibacter halelectricus]|uniref:conjugal transfer protein TraN n=1 Tax=Geoalkalibacter halelectricus TaxID=2847045 RepID=UPI003D23F37F